MGQPWPNIVDELDRHGSERTGGGTPRHQILRMSAVLARTGLGRSTIYRMIAARQFPPPVRLTGRAVGWRREDLDRWSESLASVDH
ncbi:helix-turn-helix transcriptional regulator [Rubrivivax albus]|uniref:helix-turn-helix transcriptional regulator n=1 Tax=Rubrivivax albus TaxID=2499835 RepID=UPI0018EEB7AB|nr:AlpA family phage regulatory protein [Rubrivivax albus]